MSSFESSSATVRSATSSALNRRGAEEDHGRVFVAHPLADHLGVSGVGADRVNGDRQAGHVEISLERPREADHGVLGGGVHGEPRHGREGRQRGDVDDVTVLAAPVAHDLHRRARAVHHAEDVHLDQQAHFLVGVLPGLDRAQQTGVVYPYLHRAPLGSRTGDLAVGVGIADVERPREAPDLLGGGRRRLGVDVGAEHGVAAARQAPCDLTPEAAPRTGHNRHARHQAEVDVASRSSGVATEPSGRLIPLLTLALSAKQPHVGLVVHLDRVAGRGDVAAPHGLLLAGDLAAHGGRVR